MPMPRDIYEPIKLGRSNRYAGYQFYGRVRVDGMEPEEAFRYVILTVCKWIRKKVPEEDRNVPALSLPEAEAYASVENSAFLPCHYSVGYALDITPLMESGIWALRLKEPDKGAEDERDPEVGRFFTTRIGVRLSDKGYTELGIRIDVTDPASAEKEIDFAFRPGFVRSLAIQPSVSFEQVRELKYGSADRISSEDDFKRLAYLLESEDNQLPLVVFTHTRPGDRKPVPEISMDDFIRREQAGTSLRFTGQGAGFPLPEKKELKMPSVIITADGDKPQIVPLDLPKAQEKRIPVQAPVPAQPSAEPVMPYDADKFSKSAFAYARTFVLGDRLFEKFAARVKKEIRPGDIVLCGARKFRGTVQVVGYSGDRETDLKKVYDAALLCAQSYSKHKSPYVFGNVVFEAEARQMDQQRQLRAIIEGQYEEKEKYDQLVEMVQELNQVVSDKNERIRELNELKDQAYEQGRAYGEQENARLEQENNDLRKELGDRRDQLDQMMGLYQWAKEVEDSMEEMRTVESMPSGNEEVVRYFTRVFGDRLGFTERGMKEACRCGLRPEHLWEVLYTVATRLTDVYRYTQENLTEDEVMKATGFEISFHEGSETRKQNQFMRLREDVYEGKDISVEPHIKLKSMKDEPAHQRLHFCYVPELKRIVIGYVGDHLDSAATKYVAKM